MKMIQHLTAALTFFALLSTPALAQKKEQSKKTGKAVPTWYRIEAGGKNTTVKTLKVETKWDKQGKNGKVIFKNEGKLMEIPTAGKVLITPLGGGPEPVAYGGNSSSESKSDGPIIVTTTTTTDDKGTTTTTTTTRDTSTGTGTRTTTTTTSSGDSDSTIVIVGT